MRTKSLFACVWMHGVANLSLGIYVMIGCFGYLVDFTTYFFAPDLGIQVNLFTGWGELLLCLWLLIRGAPEAS